MNKKGLFFIIIAFFLLLCSFPTALLICGFALPAQYEDSFLGELKYKVQRLEETEGKRIVLIGGSSVPFSIKSDLLESYFPDYTVVNFGMYADMGTVAMLDLASKHIQEGDILILTPEQNAQTLSCHFSGESFLQAADGAFSLIQDLSPARFEKLVAAFPVFAGKKLSYFVHGAPAINGIYARSSFNAYGDIEHPNRGYNIMSGGYNPNDVISFSEDIISADFIQEMNDFASNAANLGAYVYYRFPPMNALALEDNTTKLRIDSYYDFLQGQLTFPIIGNPHNCILDSGWFYDTNFHLNDSGAIVFTKGIIEDLKLLWKDTSPIALSSPAIPDVPVLHTTGDNTHAKFFTYLETDGGWIINGLTDKGALTESLIIPYSYQGEPVIGISETLFQENKVLRELTIQENIGVLYDHMFQGCSSLHRLILTGPSPATYTVGEHLLDGTDCLIYVPDERVDEYRRHYMWQTYSAYLMGNTI